MTEEIPHVRSLSIGYWIEAGSRDEHPQNNGISHFIEHMVFKGTKKRNVKEIAQSIESVGGYLNAFTSKEHTCYYVRVLDEHLELATDVLSDLVFQPTFPDNEFKKEKHVILEELKQAEDDPDDIIQDYFEKALENLTVSKKLILKAVDVGGFYCNEIDFESDLKAVRDYLLEHNGAVNRQ